MNVVCVHGVGQQFLGPETLLDRWRPALRDGVRSAGGDEDTLPTLSIAFYGREFRTASHSGTKGPAVAQDMLADLSDDEERELLEAAVEVLPDADLCDPTDAAKGRSRTPLPMQAVLRALDRRFGAAAGILYLGVLRQVRRYLVVPEVRARVDELVDAVITPSCRAVVGHSLGSVVAYEYFRRHGQAVAPGALITLGSPLGLRMVRERLDVRPLPGVQWTAVRDERDPVACAGPLRTWWDPVDDRVVDNGPDAHSALHYLTSEQVGGAVLAAATGAG